MLQEVPPAVAPRYSRRVAKRASAGAIERLAGRLAAELGPERVSASEAVRDRHGQGESYHAPAPPDLVVFPGSTAEVARVVAACRGERVPIVPYGAGTSLEGHVAAVAGGVCVDLSGLDRILRVSVDDLDATVEAGVTRKRLDAKLRPEGVFFPVDPGADATIGGMIATGASGTTTVRYGTMRENVLSLTVVTAAGDVVRTGSRARKSSAGYDLTRLFVGSEGTLGIVTEAIAAAVSSFPTLDAAVACVIRVIQLGLPVARVELLDEVQMDAIERRFALGHAAAPTLFFEFHGSTSGVAEASEAVGELAAEAGGGGFRWAATEDERRRLWEARHGAYEANRALRPGARGFATDVCVPISRLAECIAATRREIDRLGLVAPIVGHVGDGNFHVAVLLDPDDPDELARVEGFHERLVRRALELGGTCTGEHGVGYGKARYLPLEHGEEGVALMRQVKAALDPDGLLNPGKVLPAR